ncbi:MAG: hypothetical protein WBW84_05170, partial [Acidobacteriaceae bacterium]
EDHASVQLVLSQITHGLLSNKLDPERARALIYACQVAAATMPRPPRLPTPPQSPQTSGAPSLSRQHLGATGWEPGPESLGTGDRGLGTDESLVYHLALDYEGLISGDGDLPAPSAHWQPPSPEATPWDLIHAAPNQSKPTPISPFEPETHRNCNICAEIRRLQGIPAMHPHLQPVVNPYCKFNRPGCQGPASDSRCISCDTVYLANPRKYNRARPRPDRASEYSQDPSVSSVVESLPEPQPLPNPLPEQFPDNDPMLNGYIDLNASTESAFLYPAPCSLLLKVIPQTYYPPTPFPATKPYPPQQGGTPS